MGHHIIHRAAVTTSPFAPLTATGPDLLVPYAYASTSADGQILYEDDTATSIVDAAGDPIGGVRDLDGNLVATQSTDASRPAFLGDGLGADFDGSDDYYPVDRYAGQEVRKLSLSALAKPDAGGTYRMQLAQGLGVPSGGGALSIFKVEFDAADELEALIRDSDGGDIFSLADRGNIDFTASFLPITAQYDLDTSEMELWVDGSMVGSRGLAGFDGTIKFSTGFAVFGNPSGAETFAGVAKILIFFDRMLTDTEVSDLHTALGGL